MHAEKLVVSDSEVEEEWTMAHGHLLGMGGMTLVDPKFAENKSKNPGGQVLTIERYKELTTGDNTTFKLPKIMEADIIDKSKGDFLSRFFKRRGSSCSALHGVSKG